jgi:hypothetical protein
MVIKVVNILYYGLAKSDTTWDVMISKICKVKFITSVDPELTDSCHIIKVTL